MKKEKVNIIGMMFGRLVVQEKVYGVKKGKAVFRCKCDCGQEKYITKSHLMNGDTKSCGCLKNKIASKVHLKDLTGKRFGKLTVIKRAKNKIFGKRQKVAWKCKCDCGNEVIVTGENLNSGTTKSCGCARGEKHKMRWTRLYRIYTNIKTRCKNHNSPSYKIYGKRGVGICKEWDKSFTAFMEWALQNGYNEKLSIDRIDNNGDYCPNNCRWATMEVQANNKRNNVYYTYNGEIHTIAEWSRIMPINKKIVYQRLERGKSVKDVFDKAEMFG